MKTILVSTLAAAGVVAAIGYAGAQAMERPMFGPPMGWHAGPAMAERMLEKYDLDKDGKITQAEIDKVRADGFAAASKGSADGVTIQNFEPWFWQQHREMMVRAFQRLDRDGDGKISEAEWNRRTDGFVERFDRNGDGVLSVADMPKPRAGGPGDQRPDGHHKRPMKGPMPPMDGQPDMPPPPAN